MYMYVYIIIILLCIKICRLTTLYGITDHLQLFRESNNKSTICSLTNNY